MRFARSWVKETSLKDVIRSQLFDALREQHVLEAEHVGGCVLFTQRAKVEQIMAQIAESRKAEERR